MPSVQRVELTWPHYGIATATAFQGQPPHTSPRAVNVLLQEMLTSRFRGGSRPGLKRLLDDSYSVDGIQFVCPQYYLDDEMRPRCRLVFGANGYIYYWEEGQAAPSVCSSPLENTGLGVQAVVRYNRLFVLDGTTVKYVDFSETTPDLQSFVPDYGVLPTAPHILTRYRDRMVLVEGNQWYMSRVGNWGDWDYGADADDICRAVSGETGEVGTIGDAIILAAPQGEAQIVFGTPNGLHVLRGDPAAVGSGAIHVVSRMIGGIDKAAYCHTHDDVLLFLSQQGLTALPPTCPSCQPTVLSQDRIPQELINLPDDMLFTMVYDPMRRGAFIFGADQSAGDDIAWFFDWQRVHGYWRLSIPSDFFPVCGCLMPLGGQRTLCPVFGCRDGRLRIFDSTIAYDDDENYPIESVIDFGPLLLGGSHYSFGFLREMRGVLGVESGKVRWAVRRGRSAEEALSSDTPIATGEWSGEKNSIAWPSVSGTAIVIELSSTEKWAFESMTLVVEGYAGRRI